MHVFKYLDTAALKEEKSRNGGSYDGHTTLRRNAAAKNSSAPLTELQKIRRQNVDSGYSTSDGYDKRWSQELAPNAASTNNNSVTVTDNGNPAKWSPTQAHNLLSSGSGSGSEKSSPLATTYPQFQSHASGNSTPTNMSSPVGTINNNSIGGSNGSATVNSNHQSIDEYVKPSTLVDNSTPKRINSNGSNNNNRFVFGACNRHIHSYIHTFHSAPVTKFTYIHTHATPKCFRHKISFPSSYTHCTFILAIFSIIHSFVLSSSPSHFNNVLHAYTIHIHLIRFNFIDLLSYFFYHHFPGCLSVSTPLCHHHHFKISHFTICFISF